MIWASLLPEGEPFSSDAGGAIARHSDAMGRSLGPTWLTVGRPTPPGCASYDSPFRVTTALRRGVPRGRRLVDTYNARALAADLRRWLPKEAVLIVNNRPVWVQRLRALKRPIVLHQFNEFSVNITHRRLKRVAAECAAVVFMSESLRERGIDRCAELEKISVVVPGGADLRTFQPREERERDLIVFSGRIVPEKGVLELMDAAEELLRRGAAFRLVIIGSTHFAGAPTSAYEEEVRRRADAINAVRPATIEFTGFLPHNELAELVARARVVAVPSVWAEPFGLVVVEALASGTPVVGSSFGAIPEIVGDAGLIANPTDIPALASAIETILCLDDGSWRQLSMAARSRAENRYAWPEIAEGLSQILRSVV